MEKIFSVTENVYVQLIIITLFFLMLVYSNITLLDQDVELYLQTCLVISEECNFL